MEALDFSWAKQYPEIYKICTLFNLVELSNPLRFCYKSLPGFIQEGPQCGLVALAMYMGNPTKDSVQLLVETAKRKGYTNNGEMFSTQDMAELAKLHVTATDVQIYSGFLDSNEIKSALLHGSNLLVPYDTDKDNSPCLQNGRKAHWAVVCGAVESECAFYVLARHGKMRNVAVWKLSDLSVSNAQLNEVGVYEKDSSIKFKIPEGGIQGPVGLKCKCVVLSQRS